MINRLSKKAPLWQRLMLLACLVLLFSLSTGVENPAEESCCEDDGATSGYRITFTPSNWDPATLGTTNLSITAKLIDVKLNQEVPADFAFSSQSYEYEPISTATLSKSGQLVVSLKTPASLSENYLAKVMMERLANSQPLVALTGQAQLYYYWAGGNPNILFGVTPGDHYLNVKATREGKDYRSSFRITVDVSKLPSPKPPTV